MSDRINVSLDGIARAADLLKREADSLEMAGQNSDRAIDSLRAMESVRIGKIIDAWDVLRKNLKDNVEEVLRIADEQVKAARDFKIADDQ